MTAERLIFADEPELVRDAARLVAEAAREAVVARGAFHLALAGGTTPRALYRELARAPALLDWARTHVWFGDERCVPAEHADSNYGMANEALLSRVPVPAAQVHRLRGELEPDGAAAAYERELRHVLGDGPRLDLVLLGVGVDGHTASLFPKSSAVAERERLVVATYVDELAAHRLTLTLPALAAARLVLFLVTSRAKAPAVASALGSGERPPAGLVEPADGRLVWLLDSEAAAEL